MHSECNVIGTHIAGPCLADCAWECIGHCTYHKSSVLGTHGLNESHTTTPVVDCFCANVFYPQGGWQLILPILSARDRDQYKSSTVCRLHSLQILLTKSRMARFVFCCLVASILVASQLANALPQELVVGSACQLEVLSLCQFLIYSMLEINALFKCQLKHCSNFTFSASLCNLSRRSPQTGWSTKNEWTNATDVGPGWPWRTG